MKIIFILLFLLIITIPSSFGVPIAEKTGLKFSFPVAADNNRFFIEGTANFDVKRVSFDEITQELSLEIQSSLNDNLVEMIIPRNLLKADDLTFMITSMPLSVTELAESSTTAKVIPKIIHNDEENTFITLEFSGIGTHYLIITNSSNQNVEQIHNSDGKIAENTTESNGGGCLIATAAFGSEMAPQIQLLRELRDNTILETKSGNAFMSGFNQFYYSFSPAVADYERENPIFKEAVKLTLTPLLTSLAILNYVDIDTEQEMLGYGIGVILLNIGMYFVAPAAVIIAIKNRRK